MTRYEKLQNLIERFREEERKVISSPANKWGEHCYMRRKELENEAGNLTLAEASEIVS